MKPFVYLLPLLFAGFFTSAQQLEAVNPQNTTRCATNESIENALRKNASLALKWQREGERRLAAFLEQQQVIRGQGMQGDTIVIPVVFHLVDEASKLSGITDRDIYNQLELLNAGYHGTKADYYKRVIPKGMYDRLGRIEIKFVLARRTPEGKLTSGIERRENTTPDRISIKSYATGGLDAWDTDRYLNIWTGSLTGNDSGLLGIATPPFYTSEGPQGVVIGLGAIPYTSNVSRSYYPTYSEGATLIHEVGHYFYLWHTFGDEYYCNNNDFRIQPGWPLPTGAGPEGDDTPPEKADDQGNAHFGNPAQNYSDGCTSLSIGMMYGSFMNYFDDRAMFMFSEGMRKRVLGCIQLYRPKLISSLGATPPSQVTDAYLVSASPYGIPERRAFVMNGAPVNVRIRNYGNTVLNKITVNIQADAQPATAHVFPLSLSPGLDTVLFVQNITGTAGTHLLTIYTSSPNNKVDDFTQNDTLQSFIFITDATATAPLTENFTDATFPPEGWQVWNPNNNATWVRDGTSGFKQAGAATVANFNYNGPGQMDELIMPAIYTGVADSATLSFKVAYGVLNLTDVGYWDALEIYVSNDKGADYQLIYKKSGGNLKSVDDVQKTFFTALPSKPERWRNETVNLTPYLVKGVPLMIKFRSINAHGNNLYLDDIAVTPYISVDRDVSPYAITDLPEIICGTAAIPSVAFRSNGTKLLNSVKINFQTDNGPVSTITWTGNMTIAGSDTVQLAPLPPLEPGRHELLVYTSLPNGSSDLNPINDTIRREFYVAGRASLPQSVDFEASSFPPNGWLVIGGGNAVTWKRTTKAAADGNASMFIENSISGVKGVTDKFVSPVLTGNSGYDSLIVSFDYAYTKGGVADGIDTLELVVTRDCGQTVKTVWKKWGAELETIVSAGSAYIPGETDWVHKEFDLLPAIGEGDFQIFFIARSNAGNNLYIDNIKIDGIKVPERLKKQGYLIYPNPFTDEFIIRHYEEPNALKAAVLFNSSGQKVWQQEYNGSAFKIIPVRPGNIPAGVYSLQLIYTNDKVVEKIVKTK